MELNNNSDKAEIGMLFLQYGYKLYGPNYNLIDTTDITCLNWLEGARTGIIPIHSQDSGNISEDEQDHDAR